MHVVEIGISIHVTNYYYAIIIVICFKKKCRVSPILQDLVYNNLY